MDTKVRGQHFDNLCRTCMDELMEEFSYTASNKPEQHWRSIIHQIEECGSLPIAELLSMTIPQIEVHLSDDLPKKICCKCLEHVQSIFQFQQMCLHSDQHMRKLIAEGNVVTNVTIADGALSLEIKVEDLSEQEYFLEVKDQGNDIEAENTLLAKLHSSAVAAADPLRSTEAHTDIDIDDTHESSNDVEPNADNESNAETLLTALPAKDEVVIDGTAEQQDNESSSRNSCSICNKSFKGPRSLQAHLRCHKKSANTGLPTCKLCNKTYESRSTLLQHKKMMHSTRPRKYKCEICDMAFMWPYMLKKHLLTHGERRFLCPECGKSFTKEIYLTNHCQRHTDVMAFECPHCPKKFRTINDVTKHKVIHQEIKKHVCDLCEESFLTRYQLTVHKRRHNGIKPFRCDYCDMRFVTTSNHRMHVRTHTGEKPYKCKYCERAFAQSGDHIKHLRTHIGDNVYRCEFCPYAYRYASELRAHFASHKNDDEETRERNMKALQEIQANGRIT